MVAPRLRVAINHTSSPDRALVAATDKGKGEMRHAVVDSIHGLMKRLGPMRRGPYAA